jgi:ATP-binding cassette subfamily B protein
VQLWNRSLAGNLHYGNAPDAAGRMAYALENADLYSVLERMPDGLQSVIGEGGGLVSGGEGQRVRIGRAMLRKDVRLAILDEPARGLSRGARHEMVARMRREWRGATLLCITHDVTDTREFPRVLVVDAGQVVEDGDPAKLAADPHSRYARLLEAEQRVRRLVWGSEIWRRLRLAGGSLRDDAA